MKSLFSTDLPPQDFSIYFGRVCDPVWKVALDLLRNGKDVVLDIGFGSRESRDIARRRLFEAGAECRMYFIDCEDSVMMERLLARGSVLWSDAEVFRERRMLFEKPEEDELFELIRSDQ